jgi:hypothetical protein
VSYAFKNHWIIFREINTFISIHVNLLPEKPTKGLVKEQIFEQDLNKDRPYLIIEESEKYFLILTLTTNDGEEFEENKKNREDKPSFERFGPISCCRCLSKETYVRLETKIFIAREFVNKSYSFLDLETKNNKIKHQCLSEKQYLDLREALDIYWNTKNEQLITIELGMDSKLKDKRKNIKRKSSPLFRPVLF